MSAQNAERLFYPETELRLEAIAEALPAAIDPHFDLRQYLWLAHTLGRCEHLFGALLLESFARNSTGGNAGIDREIFRRTLRSILGPLKEFSECPSFARLMFHATGNHEFATVPNEEARLGNVDESCSGEAIETITDLDMDRLRDPGYEEEAVELFAKLHMIARVAKESNHSSSSDQYR